MRIEFEVPGIAKTAGSHNSYQGRIVHANPKTKEWMRTVGWWARKEYTEETLLTGPIWIAVHFRFMRPDYHYGTGKNKQILKRSAPDYHIKTPDLDKLVRAIQDALTGIIYKDDKQIVGIVASKGYDTRPKVTIIIKDG